MSYIKNEKSLLIDVTRRILEVCDSKNIKPVYLIKNQVGAQQTVYDVLKGKQKPGIDFLMRFLDLFPDIDSNWLLRGEGEMFSVSPLSLHTQGNKNQLSNIGSDHSNRSIVKESKGEYKNILEAKEREIEALKETVKALKQTIDTQQKLIDHLTK